MRWSIPRLLVCFLLFSELLSAQQSTIYTHKHVDYQEALSFYNNKQYNLSKQLFEQVKNETTEENIIDDCSWYIASCALKMRLDDSTSIMLNFINDFVISPKIIQAYHDLGVYYFMNNEFDKALKWLQKIERDKNFIQTEDFKFQIGYCYFSEKKYYDARKYLSQVIDSNIYGIKAHYYLGFIAYQGSNYKVANNHFSHIRGNNFSEGKLSYYRSYIKFISDDYRGAIQLGLENLTQSDNLEEQSQLNKIIGESQFKLSNYKAAIKYLKAYNGPWQNTDYYQLGYAYYKLQNYKEAITYFNKIIGERSVLSQNTYYHLGKCYFKTNDKIKALTAFSEASRLNFNKQIQQDAWLNRVRLSYEIGDLYQSNVVILDSFIKKYPESPYKIEINRLLANALVSSKNYNKALEVLQANNSHKNYSTYQRLSYAKGNERYKQKEYDKAIQYFKKSIEETIDSTYYIRAKYRIGSAHYLKEAYDAALLTFRDLQISTRGSNNSIIRNLDYDMGYCYFKLRAFDKAMERFKVFINQAERSPKKTDAIIRLADCYLADKKYDAALANYQEVIDVSDIGEAYCRYQSILIQQYISDNDTVLRQLNDFIKNYPDSKYVDDAYLYLAKILYQQKKYLRAIATYEKLKLNIPYSPLYAKVLINQADAYQKIKQNDKAIENYKIVVHNFPKTQESIEAVGLAKALYIKIDQLKDYATWVQKINFNDRADYDSEIKYFKLSKSRYNELRQTEGLKSYIRDYPDGLYSAEANYLLANEAKKRYDTPVMITHLKAIIEGRPNRFRESSLFELSRSLYDKGKYAKSMIYLTQLAKEARIDRNQRYAYLKMGQIAYLSEQYTKAENNVNKVKKIGSTDDNFKAKIELLLSKIYVGTDRTLKALPILKNLSQSKDNTIAAEALYYLALCQQAQKILEESNDSIMTLTKNYSEFKNICGHGLLILAENYVDLKDFFQASFVLESITQHYKDYPDLVQQAKNRLKIIED